MGKALLILAALLAGVVIYAAQQSPQAPPVPPTPEQQAAKQAEQRRADAAAQKKVDDDRRFTAEVRAVKTLQRNMKNPDSFKLESAVRMADGVLCLKYRATNSFNAIVPGAAVITPAATVTSDHGDARFVGVWNARCGSKSGTDVSHIAYALKMLD